MNHHRPLFALLFAALIVVGLAGMAPAAPVAPAHQALPVQALDTPAPPVQADFLLPLESTGTPELQFLASGCSPVFCKACVKQGGFCSWDEIENRCWCH
ncbi:MAG TPA: hypothetical protein VGS22_29450 [Thermoanaerobaculia bacterium]|jgi:hypothetical protein|nr:hypothetical protein [Thermoanaerobaculia bacterium]